MKNGSRKSLGSRTGFTLVELLVVISIIGMLMAMLFPAINAARESGRQNTCRNNMRSVVTAVIGFESKKNAFPMLRNPTPNPDTSTPPANAIIYRSLVFVILPEMERNDIYNAARTAGWDSDPSNPPSLELQNLYLEFLQCPSNPLTRTGDDSENMAFVFNSGRLGITNSTGPGGSGSVQEKFAGMFFETGSPNSTADLTAGDGAVNTLLASESLYNVGTGPKWNSLNESRVGFTWDPGSSTDGINRQPTANGVAPSANHPGIVNVGFADSHVRVLNDTTDYTVYSQLCTPRGTAFGQPVLSEGDY